MHPTYLLDLPRSDVLVIGSGPNGLAAAIVAAQAGRSVTIIESENAIGGGLRSEELTLPGFIHDVCAAVFPMAVSSPFFHALPLDEHGLEWIYPEFELAHPLDDGSAVVLHRSLDETAAQFSATDAAAYRRLLGPIAEDWDKLINVILGPPRLPRHPLALARFGLQALRSAAHLAKSNFSGEPARALVAGLAAHSSVPLEKAATASFALVLAAAGHAVGWPIARGGSQQVANALAAYLISLGGKIITGCRVRSLDQLPASPLVLCDITPRQLLTIAGERLPNIYRSALAHYRYGLGVFKMDWALDGPIPWRAAECARAGTVHLGGMLEEISASERGAWRGKISERPFVILAQPSLFDSSRAPAGRHTAWAYCHVPNGSRADMTERIEAQIERFAPGFRRRVLARSVKAPAALGEHNSNYVGGDIAGGATDIFQMFIRPTLRLYATPDPRLYLCSSSTPPGGGVHGMCGYWAASLALRRNTQHRDTETQSKMRF